MKKTAIILYGLNSVTCIFIGILHTLAHYNDLITEEIHGLLNHEIMVSGMTSNIWGLWQGMSLMMGGLLIIIGLLNLLIIKRLGKNDYPPIESSLIMILMLLGVMYVGHYLFESWQVYGGAIGIAVQTVCLVLSLRKD